MIVKTPVEKKKDLNIYCFSGFYRIFIDFLFSIKYNTPGIPLRELKNLTLNITYKECARDKPDDRTATCLTVRCQSLYDGSTVYLSPSLTGFFSRRNGVKMRLFTSEQVSCGHPDKVCDFIADTILDDYIAADPASRVALEVLIKNEHVVLAGEITSKASVDRKAGVRKALEQVGLDFDFKLDDLVFRQSPDIAMGVDTGGAGDQGIMFGYACDETPECLPLSYMLATDALKELRALRHPLLGPDAKSQVTVRFQDDGTSSIDTFLISTQHREELPIEAVREIAGGVMETSAKKYGMNCDFRKLCNPTGRFVIGGSFGDAGVTGRKIICDTYGGGGRHGGGAFSGKDPTKVDRSAAYMARYLSKYLLKKHGLHEAEVQLSYAIGVREPVSVAVTADRNWNSTMAEELLRDFDLTPRGIIEFLGLRNVRFSSVSSYGHFTNQDMPWEKV